MAEKISVQSVTDIITSKAGREYFTLEDISQKRYVCFIVKLKEFCKVGTEIEADFTPGKSADDSPRLDMIYVNGKPVVSVEKKATGRSCGKSKEELLQIRQLAEAQNRSIQAQTSLNRATDLAVAIINQGSEYTAEAIGKIESNAKTFYQLLQSLTLISEAKVIHQNIKEAKSDKKTNSKSKAIDQQQGEERTSGPPSGEALELLPKETERVRKFLEWIISKDENIKEPRIWLEVEYAVPKDEPLSDKKCEALFKTIKQKKGW